MSHKLSKSLAEYYHILKIRWQSEHSDLFSVSYNEQLSRNVFWDMTSGEEEGQWLLVLLDLSQARLERKSVLSSVFDEWEALCGLYETLLRTEEQS